MERAPDLRSEGGKGAEKAHGLQAVLQRSPRWPPMRGAQRTGARDGVEVEVALALLVVDTTS